MPTDIDILLTRINRELPKTIHTENPVKILEEVVEVIDDYNTMINTPEVEPSLQETLAELVRGWGCEDILIFLKPLLEKDGKRFALTISAIEEETK